MQHDRSPARPTIALVVPCRNDAALLDRCLASFADQTVPFDGIIVVDNGSTDDSAAVARSHGAVVIPEERVGITWAMRAGLDAAAARGFDIALRTDADVVAGRGYVDKLRRAWDRERERRGTRVVALTGDARFDIPGWRGDALSRAYLGAYRLSVGSALGHAPLFGSNCAIDLRWWEEVRGSVDSADTYAHDDIQLSFAVRADETVAYVRDLTLVMDDRALRGAAQIRRRFARGWHSMMRGFAVSPPWRRLPRRLLARTRVGTVSPITQGWLRRYDAMSHAAANTVIEEYSTSFSMATNLLSQQVRRDIRNLYAVVRIADEIVDGTAREAEVDDIDALLDAYERQVLAAPGLRFHTDPVMHAYAETARRCGFDPEHVRAFFASMRRDLHQHDYDAAEFDDYVYGSAEVIGLLCLSVFLVEMNVTEAERDELIAGARSLGAAFQKVNFLRDIGEDSGQLGRTYFPELRGREITDDIKADLVADIRSDLAAATAPMELLPRRIRAAVLAASLLFTELTDMIEATPAAELAVTRVSVPQRRKALLTAQAAAATYGLRKK